MYNISMKSMLLALATFPFIAASAPLPSLTGCLPPDIRTVAIVMPGSVLAKPGFDKGVAMLRAADLDFREFALEALEAGDEELDELWSGKLF